MISNTISKAGCPPLRNAQRSSQFPPRFKDISLQEWVKELKPNTRSQLAFPLAFDKENIKYIKSALPIALKLSELLIEGEDEMVDDEEEKNARANTPDQASNNIPISCVRIEHIIVRIKELSLPTRNSIFDQCRNELPIGRRNTGVYWDEFSERKSHFPLDFGADIATENPTGTLSYESYRKWDYRNVVSAMFFPSHESNLEIGTKSSRLFAFGEILYQLFSGQKPVINKAFGCQDKKKPSTDHESSSFVDFNRRTRRFKSQKATGSHSHSLAQLDFLGVPQSVCILIQNLFDCYQGDSVSGDAYKSFRDVRRDLKLMIDDPDIFLEDIKVEFRPTFSSCDLILGREKEIATIGRLYGQRMIGKCQGIIITGSSGIGKSKLATQIPELTRKAGGYFLGGKFDQNQHTKPLNIIASVFNKYCDLFINDNDNKRKKGVSEALESALGSQASALIKLLPSLKKLMHLPEDVHSNNFVDSEKRLHYLFCVCIEVLSSFISRPITLFLDDLQWADDASLSLLRSIIVDAKGSKHLFFVGCVRIDDKGGRTDHIFEWIRFISAYDIVLEKISLNEFSPDTANKLVSYSLRLSPRLTQTLANTLHHKTGGNPLFFKRLLESLREEGLIYFSLNPRRWMWDLDKIMTQEVADDVVDLLMRKMSKLADNLQQALKVASCIGATIDKSLLGILSNVAKIDLHEAMDSLAKKSYMDIIGTKYRFVHDKIQQAAYRMIPPHQRPIDHLRYGIAICAHSLEAGGNQENDGTFFVAVNQINDGGPDVVDNPTRKTMIAALNLKAGKQSIALSDFLSALKFFEHGISFLNVGHWGHQYELSLELYDCITQTASSIGDVEAAAFYSEAILANAKCIDDKLNALHAVVRSLRIATSYREAKEKAFEFLHQLGEELPLPLGDSRLDICVQQMNMMLSKMDDDYILNLNPMTHKKTNVLMKLYLDISLIVQCIDQSLLGGVSLRMVQLSLLEGLCPTSTLAFARFGSFLVSFGYPSQGHRLGKLALQLLQKLNATEYTSSVLALVNGGIAWTAEPIQSTNVAHMEGYKAGKQSGDEFFSMMNYQQHLISNFVSGQRLQMVRNEAKEFIQGLALQSKIPRHYHTLPLYFQTIALIEGPPDELNEIPSSSSLLAGSRHFPSEETIISFAKNTKNSDIALVVHIHQMIRAFLFRKYDLMVEKVELVHEFSSRHRTGARILFVIGTFYEGLISSQIARRTMDQKWIKRAEDALSTLKYWSQFSMWNFKNKALLLESEHMVLKGEVERAESLYNDAIQTSTEHKFVHEEGIACELAALFHLGRKSYSKSMALLARSRNCYQKWGAEALVSRVEQLMENEFDPKNMLSEILNKQSEVSNGSLSSIMGQSVLGSKRQLFH